MDSSDVARISPPAADPAGSRAAGRLPPDGTAELSGAVTGERAARPVPGAPPRQSPWVLVSEVALADGDRVVVGLVGEIDIANAGYLRAELAYLIDSGHVDIVADLTRTVSISSSGLGVLVGALKTVRRIGGRLELVAAADSLLKVLRITRLTQVFTIHPTLNDAMRR
jgi:anti-sigma B factor antagonist